MNNDPFLNVLASLTGTFVGADIDNRCSIQILGVGDGVKVHVVGRPGLLISALMTAIATNKDFRELVFFEYQEPLNCRI